MKKIEERQLFELIKKLNVHQDKSIADPMREIFVAAIAGISKLSMNNKIERVKRILLIFILINFIIVPTAYADSNTEIGRYLTISNNPKKAQVDLLSQIIQVRFPQNVQTVGDAMNYILRLSGYSLVPAEKMCYALKTTLSKTLPAVDRDFGPMPLRDALTTLAGPAFYLVQDPLNRMVDFHVKSQYVHLYNSSSHTNA